jgi:hypothetical protein
MTEKKPRKKRKDAGQPRVRNPLGVTATNPVTNGVIVTDEATKRRAKQALEKETKNPYPQARGKVYLRVVLQVLDDTKQILDVAHRTYEHPPELAKSQFDAIKLALFHNKPGVGDDDSD